MVLPPTLRLDFNSLFTCLLSSRADSIVKKYLEEITILRSVLLVSQEYVY